MTATPAQAANGPKVTRQGRVESDPLAVRALARGLAILSLYDVDHREWTIDEIAARTGLLRMTAYRMVRTLEATEFLVRDTTTNQYHLGPAAITMAYVASRPLRVRRARAPVPGAAARRSPASRSRSRLPVDGVPVCVSILNSSRPFQRQLAPGRIVGDLASVHGKIFTAFASPQERAEVLAQERRQHTPRTVTDPAALARELDRVGRRRRGVRRGGAVRQRLLRRLAGPRSARQRRGRDERGHAGRPVRPAATRPLHTRGQGGGCLFVRLSRLEPGPPWSRPTD